MKRFLLLALAVTFTLGLSACIVNDPDPDPDPECTDTQELVDGVCVDKETPDTVAPVIAGAMDKSVYVNDETFALLDGVTATDDVDGDLTSSLEATGEFDITTAGEYDVTFKVSDAAGNLAEVTVTITVEVTPDTTAPVITGVMDQTVYLDDETFSLLDGVTATDDRDGNLTDSIEVATLFDITAEGDYYVVYKVTDAAGNMTQVSATVTVEVDPSTIGDEMVPNGDFSMGTALWGFDGGGIEGGTGNISAFDDNGEDVLAVEITAASWNAWEPRLRSDGITFENGKTYEISFDAKALAARSVHVQVGEILSGAPWFTNFKQGQTDIFDIGTDWANYTFKFTMNLDTNENGSLIFEHGTVEGGVGIDNLVTTVYYDNIVIEEATPDPDTAGPEFSGLDALTLNQGAEFDALDGVTAYDAVEGDIALTEANVTGLDTLDLFTAGVYTVTYTAQDSLGNETIATREITVVAINFIDADQIVDGTFDTTTEIIDEVQDENNGYADITAEDVWYNYVAGWDGAAATFTVVDGAVVANVTAAGNNDWGVMLKQKGVDLLAGNMYRLTFTASATVDRDMVAKVTDNFYKTVQLTSTPTEFEFIFLYAGENVQDVVGEKVIFLLGNTAGFAAGTVTIDNVNLQIEGEEPLDYLYKDSEQVVDPSFDTTTEIIDEVQDENNGWADITAEDVWYNYVAGWDGAAATFTVVDGAAVANVTAAGNNDWGVMLKQKGIELTSGVAYKLTFTASADVERDIVAKVTDNFFETFQLTATPTEFSFEFVYDGEDVTGERIVFLLGNTAAFAAGTVTIDNVMLSVGIDPSLVLYEDGMQVVDPSFDTTTEIIAEVQDENNGWADITAEDVWYQYTASWDGAAAAFSVVDGMMQADVTASGNNDWGVMLKQKGIDLVDGRMYKLVFTAYASADRDIIAKVTDNHFEMFNLTATPTEFSFEFLYTGGDVTGERILFLLGKTEAFAAGVVTIDDVMLLEGINPQELSFASAMQVTDGMFDTTTEIIAEVQDTPENGYADITPEDVWYQYTAGWDGAAATFTVVDGMAQADITAAGNNDWGVMLKQKGVDLVQGTVYKLTFTAYASADRDIVAKVTDGYWKTFELTATPTEFEFSFLYTGDDVMGERILFLLGNTPEFAAGVVTIDNVELLIGS